VSFTATFNTKRTDSVSGPSGSQTRVALDFFLGYRGRDDSGHERHAAFWTDFLASPAPPALSTYATYGSGLLIPLYLQTAAAGGNSWSARASILKGDGSFTAIPPTTARTWQGVSGTFYGWTVAASGTSVSVTQGVGAAAVTAVFSSSLIGTYAAKGAFIFLAGGGREVEVTDFHVTAAAPVPSLGGLVAQISRPGRWPSRTLTYAYPGSGYTYSRSSDTGLAGIPGLATSWQQLSTAAQGGFDRGFAAWQAALGGSFAFTKVSNPASADILVTRSNVASWYANYNGWGIPPTNGGIFISPVVDGGTWGLNTYCDQVAIHEIGHAVLGLKHPEPTSAVNDYSLTVMVSNSISEERWWATPRQADIDAALIDYDSASAP
jgi:hypothetical protein